MPNKIWEMTAIVEQYNIDNELLLWNECMRLLDGPKDNFLKDPISNIPDVNDGFVILKKWLITKDVSPINGTLIYALQVTVYNILVKCKDHKDKPKNLTTEWLRLKQINLQTSYSELTFANQNLLDILGATVIMLDNYVENHFYAEFMRDLATYSILQYQVNKYFPILYDISAFISSYIKDRESQHDRTFPLANFLIYILLVLTLNEVCRRASQATVSFFNNRQLRQQNNNDYLPALEPELKPELRPINQ